MSRIGPLAGLALLAGCATHPITGRDQILVLPAVQAAYADAGYALTEGVRRIAATPTCEHDCPSPAAVAQLAGRVAQLGAMLEASARGMSTELFGRIDGFQIEVNHGMGVGTGSSAGGRIALGAGLAALEPADAVIAFLIAREMAHVIARHAEENSGASVVFSVLGMLLPGFNVVARFIVTSAASNALRDSWASHQQREADEIALALLERMGLSALDIAFAVQDGAESARLPDSDWATRYAESVERVVRIAALPRYAAAGP